MREIKFRAWDKEEKCWIPANKFSIIGKGDMLTYDECSENMLKEVLFDENKIELMQYTGLKDKNGKEIYEGDIVEIQQTQFVRPWSEQPERLHKYDTPKIKRHEVVFENGMFLRGREQGLPLPDRFEDYEVIGNIYENPELLLGGENEEDKV